jgi:hypothetical protein
LQIAQAIGAAPQIMQCLAERDDGCVEGDVYTGVVLQDSGNSLASRMNKVTSSTFKKLETMLMQAERLRDVKFVFESMPPEKVAGVLNGRTEAGHTLLHCACRHSSAAVVLYLIQSRGFKCNVVTATGDFALHIAVSRIVEEQQSFASIRVLQALLSCIQSEWITMFNATGLNPLHLAVKLSCLSATKLILNSSPDSVLCCTETSGQNIIHLAAQQQQQSFMEFLLCFVKDAGFNPSDCSMIQDKVGRTARVLAASAHDNAGKGEQTARPRRCSALHCIPSMYYTRQYVSSLYRALPLQWKRIPHPTTVWRQQHSSILHACSPPLVFFALRLAIRDVPSASALAFKAA